VSLRLRQEIQAALRRGDGELSVCSVPRRTERATSTLKFEQDLSKESGVRGAILEEKTEESAIRTIESKGFLQTSPLPLGYRALLNTLAFRAKKVHLSGGHEGHASEKTNTGAGDGGRTRDIDLGKVALYH
jgi:hypothetical protein